MCVSRLTTHGWMYQGINITWTKHVDYHGQKWIYLSNWCICFCHKVLTQFFRREIIERRYQLFRNYHLLNKKMKRNKVPWLHIHSILRSQNTAQTCHILKKNVWIKWYTPAGKYWDKLMLKMSLQTASFVTNLPWGSWASSSWCWRLQLVTIPKIVR